MSVFPEYPFLTITDFEDSCSSSYNSEDSSSANGNEEDENRIKCYQQLSVDGKASKVCICTRIDETENALLDKIKEVKLHIFVKKEQYNTYNCLKNKMPNDAVGSG